ncbi:MAG: hypothetical protein GWP39_04950 [Planctomycetia bacterium]|nr:hypothetical protein [Planctomycetia bacterium]
MILLLSLMLGVVLLSWANGQLRGDLLSRGVLKCFMFPALIPDALARTIACLATATPIKGLSPWTDGEPLFIAGNCPVERLGLPLSSVLRTIALITASLILVLNVPGLSTMIPSPETLEIAAQRGPEAFFSKFATSTKQWLGGGAEVILALVMLAGMTLAAGLRHAEAIATLCVFVGFTALMQAGDWLGIRMSTFGNGWFMQRFYEAEFGKALILLALISTATTLGLLVLHAVPASIGKLRPRRVNNTGRLVSQS